MSTSNIFFKGCASSELILDEEQQRNWDELNARLIADGEQPVSLSLVDESCARETNTCGLSLQDLLNDKEETFQLNPQEGAFGGIDISSDRLYIKNHGLDSGRIVTYTVEGANSVPIGGLVSGARYFVKVINRDYIELYLDANLSNRVDITSEGVTSYALSNISIESDTFDLGIDSGDNLVYRPSNNETPIGGILPGRLYSVFSVGTKFAVFDKDNRDNDLKKDLSGSISGSHYFIKTYKHQLVTRPYELYDYQRGVLFKSWGDIEFPWKIGETTPNLNYSETKDEWDTATYVGNNAYYEGDRVLYIEDDGYEMSIYQANEDIPAPAGPLDRTKWTKVCSIQLPEPVKLPSIEELIATYEFYHLKEYLEDWGEAESTWNQDLTPRDSDEWDDYKIRRDFFYKVGDFALVEAECSDAFCLWINIRDMPVTDENLTIFSKFSPYYDFKGAWTSTDANTIRVNQFKHPYKVNDVIKVIVVNDVPAFETNDATSIKEYTINSIIDENNFTYTTTGAVPISSTPKTINIVQVQFWEKIYCVNSGQNKCLGPQSKRNLENYQFVQIGSEGHYVEQPIPNYKLKGNYLCDKDNFVDLNEAAELRPRAILTQDEINSLGAINYAVTVQSVTAGNRYFIDGVQQATLNLVEGETYRFNQNDSSNANHPLRFSTTSNGTHGGGVEFTEGVTKVGIPGNSDAYIQITIPIGTPTLYYYCANHSLMGGIANT